MLAREQVVARLRYDRETGYFFWIATGERAGWLGERGYRRISLGKRSYYEHRLAWLLTRGKWPTSDVDHVNGDRSDNRDENLREATRQQNLQNGRAKGGSSQFKGVHFNRSRGKWQAYITENRSHRYLGAFETEQDAAAAYDAAAKESFGSFAKLNLLEKVA